MKQTHYDLACNAEVAAWASLARGASPSLRKTLGLSVETIGDTVALRATQVDHPLLNRAFSFRGMPDDAAAIVAHYRAAGIRKFFVHRQQAEHGSRVRPVPGLTVYRRNWVKLAGRVGVPPQVSALDSLVVRPASSREAAACGERYCKGFDVPLIAAELFAGAVSLPDWHVFVAPHRDRAVAGVGILFVSDGVGYLSGAVTAPEFRGRGVQRALLAARVQVASDLHCEWLVSETGQDAVGDPQHSLRNMQRFGLEVVGVTENLVVPGLVWDHGVRREPAVSRQC